MPFFELLGVATRSPSGVNCQPWEIYIVVGEALKELESNRCQAYTVDNKAICITEV